MRKILRSAPAVAIGLLGVALTLGSAMTAVPAEAQGLNSNNSFNPYNFNSSTYSYGLNLPQVTQPTSSDEVRAADGTTCKSSIAGNGAYLDVGGIGSQDVDGLFNQGSVYGRVIIPLGAQPNRIDCTGLYQLEIQRLQGELQLVRMGLNGASTAETTVTSSKKKGSANDVAWAKEGWSNSGWAASTKLGGPDGAEPTKQVTAKPVAARPRPAKPSAPVLTAKATKAPSSNEQLIETGSTPATHLDDAIVLIQVD